MRRQNPAITPQSLADTAEPSFPGRGEVLRGQKERVMCSRPAWLRGTVNGGAERKEREQDGHLNCAIEQQAKRSPASRAGGRRAAAAAGPAAGAVGGPAHAELRETLLRLLRAAGGADHLGVRTEDQLLEAALAFRTLILVDRHTAPFRQAGKRNPKLQTPNLRYIPGSKRSISKTFET